MYAKNIKQKIAAGLDAGEIVVWCVDTTAQLMKPLVNKFNDLKKSASAEIQRLNQKCKIIQSSTKEEISRLKASLTDSKEQINSLREENNRKIKLINSFKTVKNSEDNSVEQVNTK